MTHSSETNRNPASSTTTAATAAPELAMVDMVLDGEGQVSDGERPPLAPGQLLFQLGHDRLPQLLDGHELAGLVLVPDLLLDRRVEPLQLVRDELGHAGLQLPVHLLHQLGKERILKKCVMRGFIFCGFRLLTLANSNDSTLDSADATRPTNWSSAFDSRWCSVWTWF